MSMLNIVEKTIKNSNESLLTLDQLKKELPWQVSHKALTAVLKRLEARGKIVSTVKGITWIHNTNANLKRVIATGTRL